MIILSRAKGANWGSIPFFWWIEVVFLSIFEAFPFQTGVFPSFKVILMPWRNHLEIKRDPFWVVQTWCFLGCFPLFLEKDKIARWFKSWLYLPVGGHLTCHLIISKRPHRIARWTFFDGYTALDINMLNPKMKVWFRYLQILGFLWKNKKTQVKKKNSGFSSQPFSKGWNFHRVFEVIFHAMESESNWDPFLGWSNLMLRCFLILRGWNPAYLCEDYHRIPIKQRVSRHYLGGGNSKYFLFSPRKLGKMNPFWRSYFSKGLVQPPTRRWFPLKQ